MSDAAPARIKPVVPVLSQRGDFVPVLGGFLQVSLPGEIVRCVVEEVLSRDVMTARIKSVVMGKTGHPYRTGDLVAVKRVQSDLSETWEPISDREVREQEERERAAKMAQQDAERAAEEAAAEAEPKRKTARKAKYDA